MSELTTYAFIDSQNLNRGIRSLRWDLDFAKFRTFLEEKYNVSKAYVFLGNVVGNEELYTALQDAGYIVILKPTVTYTKEDEDIVKGNVDAELVLRAMVDFESYDKAIIVTGDGDFACLIKHLHAKRKLAHLMVPNQRKYSSLLKPFEQYIVFVSELKDLLEKKKSGSPQQKASPAPHTKKTQKSPPQKVENKIAATTTPSPKKTTTKSNGFRFRRRPKKNASTNK